MGNKLENIWKEEALLLVHQKENRHDSFEEFLQDYEKNPTLQEEFIDGYIVGRKKCHEELELQTNARKEALGFSLDYQMWANDFFHSLDLEDKNLFMTFQNMRRQAYTHAIQNGRTPEWGDPSYLSEEFGSLSGLENKVEGLEKELQTTKVQLERAETVSRCVLELDILGKDNQEKMVYIVKRYFQDKKDGVK